MDGSSIRHRKYLKSMKLHNKEKESYRRKQILIICSSKQKLDRNVQSFKFFPTDIEITIIYSTTNINQKDYFKML